VPLELRWHPRRKAVLSASDPAYLDAVLAEEQGWREIADLGLGIGDSKSATKTHVTLKIRNQQSPVRNFFDRAVFFMEATTMERISFASFFSSIKRFSSIKPASTISSIQ